MKREYFINLPENSEITELGEMIGVPRNDIETRRSTCTLHGKNGKFKITGTMARDTRNGDIYFEPDGDENRADYRAAYYGVVNHRKVNS